MSPIPPHDHPQLLDWLTTRRAAHPAWCRETGRGEDFWDFTPGSLHVLEQLIRDRYRDDEQMHADRLSNFLQGACWYVGEVAVRERGHQWRFDPFAVGDAPLPDLFASGEPGMIDSPTVAAPRERQGTGPMELIRSLFWELDDIDEPLDAHLTDILDGRG